MGVPVTEYAFCRHGVFLGDANPNFPCPKCAAETVVHHKAEEE